MRDYDAYLFDWDGTLAQTLEESIQLVAELSNRYGLYPTRQDITTHFGDWKAPLHLGLPEEQLEQFIEEYKPEHARRLSQAPLYDGVTAMLQTLKIKGKKIALLTNSYSDVIDAVLAHHDIVDMFDLVITAGDVTEHKPHPEGILFVLGKLGVSRGKGLMLGDSVKDLGAAANARVDSLLFYPPAHEQVYELPTLTSFNPKFVVRDWQEVIDAVQ